MLILLLAVQTLRYLCAVCFAAWSCGLRSRRPYWKRMGFGVENILVETDEVGVVWEEQEQVFESLSQEETLHLVPGTGVVRVPHVIDGGVATRRNLRVSTDHVTKVHGQLVASFKSTLKSLASRSAFVIQVEIFRNHCTDLCVLIKVL